MGDLPPFFTEEATARLFSQFGPVSEVTLVRDYCYGFVRFADAATARAILREFAEKPLTAQGHMLRVREAYGRTGGRQVSALYYSIILLGYMNSGPQAQSLA